MLVPTSTVPKPNKEECHSLDTPAAAASASEGPDGNVTSNDAKVRDSCIFYRLINYIQDCLRDRPGTSSKVGPNRT